MKKFLKIFFISLASLLGLVILSVAILYISLTNSDYNVPYEVYQSEATFADALELKVDNAISNMDDDYYLDILVSADDFNELLYGIIVDNINASYKPTELDVNQHYVYRFPYGDGPVLEDGFTIHHIYSEIEDEQLAISICFSPVTFFKSKLKLFIKCETQDDKYVFEIVKVRIGKITFKADSKILKKIMNRAEINTAITDVFTKASLPIKYTQNTMNFEMSKDDFYHYLEDYLTNDQDVSYSDLVMIDILANPQYDVLDFYTDNGLGIGIDLSYLKTENIFVNQKKLITEEFDKELLIKNKTNNILFNSLLTNKLSISITENELGKILYSETQGYHDFTRTISVGKGIRLQFKIEAIYFTFSNNKININIEFNIEGIKTFASIETTPVSSNEGLNLVVSDYMYIGDFKVHSMFFIEMLELALDENSIFKASTADKTLSINLNSFNKMLNIGDAFPRFSVDSLIAKEGALSFVLTALNDDVNDVCVRVVDKLKGIVSDGSLDYSKLNISGNQEQTIEEMKNVLNTLGEKINSSSATMKDAEHVIAILDDLNKENQEAFAEMIEDALGSDIVDLYAKLFD